MQATRGTAGEYEKPWSMFATDAPKARRASGFPKNNAGHSQPPARRTTPKSKEPPLTGGGSSTRLGCVSSGHRGAVPVVRSPRGVHASEIPIASASENIAVSRNASCGVSSRFPPMSKVMFTSVSLSSAKDT